MPASHRPREDRPISQDKKLSHPSSINREDLDFLFFMAINAERAIENLNGVIGPLRSLHITALRSAYLSIGVIDTKDAQTTLRIPVTIERKLFNLAEAKLIKRSSATGNSLDTIDITNKGEDLLLRILKKVVQEPKKFGSFIRDLQETYRDGIHPRQIRDIREGTRAAPDSVLEYLQQILFPSKHKKMFQQLIMKERTKNPFYLE